MKNFTAQFRAEFTGSGLVGRAAVFGQVAKIGRTWEEMAPTAFDAALRSGEPIVATMNHDPRYLLASTESGTLRVGVDADGLVVEIPELPDTSYVRDLRALMERGDLAHMSIGFVEGEVSESRAPDGRLLRSHTSVSRLFDVSVVPLPAYSETSVALRAADWTSAPQPMSAREQYIRLDLRHLLKEK